MLDGPDGVEAELVGQADLLQGVHVHLALGLALPRSRHGQLVEDPELHGLERRNGAVAGSQWAYVWRSCRPCPIHPDAPNWFRRAVAVPFEDGWVTVDGARIHFVAWGAPGGAACCSSTAAAANAHWWTHLAARFADDFRVVAIDLSGHGDSDHRDGYQLEQWTDEVIAVAAAAGIDGLPVVIGHSLGGFVTIATAARHATARRRRDRRRLAGDHAEPGEPEPVRASNFGRPRVYPDVESAVSRFRAVPEQRHNLDYVIDHVARRSLKPVDGGWAWKFDRTMFDSFGGSMRGIARPYLPRCAAASPCCAPSTA